MDSNSILYNTIIIYILLMAVFYLIKPSFLYSQKYKKFKSYGCDVEETICPIHVFSIILCIMIYLLFSLIEFIYVLIEKNEGK